MNKNTTSFSPAPSQGVGVVQQAAAVAVAAGIPTILWGEPGIGKTAWVKQFAEKNGLHLEIVLASIREPTDFSGLPIVTEEGVSFAPPSWARRLQKGGLLFLDEISTAPPAVQAALLRVVLDKTVGDLEMPPTVKILAAANPAEAAAGGWDLTPPLANRFLHLSWPVDRSGIAKGFLAGWEAPHSIVLPKNWEENIRMGLVLVGAFLERSPENIHARPTERSRAGGAWPSPRTWEYVARVYAACKSIYPNNETTVLDTLIAGCVGEGSGGEFISWLEDQDLLDPEEVLSDPEGFEIPDRGDRAYVLARAVVATALSKIEAEQSVKIWQAAWRVLDRIGDKGGKDIIIPPAQDLVKVMSNGFPIPREVEKLFDTLNAAGMIPTAKP